MRSLFLALLFLVPALARGDAVAPLSSRGLKICVSSDAPQVVRDAANQVLAAVSSQPLLVVMAGGKPPGALTDSAALMKGPVSARAYNHLVVVGLADDPLIQALWQREALVSDQGIYVFGFGNLRGDIGYIESDRNPFMHSQAIKSTPFETEVVTLTGTTPEGVRQALAAFLAKGLTNGVVAGPGWSRPSPTLLDRDPLPPDFALPAVPPRVGGATCVGVTSPNESVYRGVLESAGVEPLQMWQFKYYVPGAWDGAGLHRSIAQFLAGLNRMSYDNALLVARFSNADDAASAARKIGAHWPKQGDDWIGTPNLAGDKDGSEARVVRLWAKGDCVFISTLPGLDSNTMP